MKHCCIIMSTYNGEKYIAHQLESILKQIDVIVDIFIRDDGSNDSTVSIIKEYCKKNNNIHIIEGNNVGVIESFRLISLYVLELRKTYDYYSFSDQDDVWHPEKLKSAIKFIESRQTNKFRPVLYYSNLKVTDNELHYLFDRFPKGYVLNSKRQMMSEICVLGCTCVFNSNLLKEYVVTNLNHRIPHDAWIAVLAMFLGDIFYDENGYIFYRQHEKNQSGNVKKGIAMYWAKLKRFRKIFDMDGDYEAIAKEMLNNYTDIMSESDMKMMRTVALYRSKPIYKAKLLFTPYISSGHFCKEVSRRIRIVCNRL